MICKPALVRFCVGCGPNPDQLLGHAPSRRRKSTNWPIWYALWSAVSSACRRMVCPSPCGIFANRSVDSESTRSHNLLRSLRKVCTLFPQAAALAGALVLGQYPPGHSGDLCFGFTENSRMSHWAILKCSSSCQGECSAPFGLRPRRLTGMLLIAASKSAWACLLVRRSTTCWRRAESFFIVWISFPFCCPVASS